MVKVGILEFQDNEFMRSVASGLGDLAPEFIRVGQCMHPSPPRWRVIIDRVSFCDPFLRQVMRYWSIAGAYVLNSPFFTRIMDKFSELLLYDALSIRHPRTVLLPRANTREDVREMVADPDWAGIESQIGFPCVLKPVDGYAWQDVFRVEDPTTLRTLYESFKESRTLVVQELVRYAAYYRAFCVGGSDVLLTRWEPRPFDRGEYSVPAPDGSVDPAVLKEIELKSAALNAALGLDFNTVEWCVAADGTPTVIDSYNDVPDVRREKLPPACYDWVVDRFCACVRAKAASDERNAMPPLLLRPASSETRAASTPTAAPVQTAASAPPSDTGARPG